ncbi:MAG: glycosyltransferase family 4 protein, partial [Propionicimonas sp.]
MALARVALVASSYLPRVGGVEEHVRHVARELRRRGHEVVIWAVEQGDDVPEQADGILLRYLPCPLPTRSVGGVLSFAGSFAKAWTAWQAAWRTDRPEVLHVHCFGPNGAYATALARRRGLSLLYSHHGETFMDAHQAFDTSALLRRSLRVTLRRAAAVTSCSAYAAADLERFGLAPDQVQVVFNGVDLTEPVGRRPDGMPARYVAGVGRLVEVKGFENLITAFALVADEVPDVDLVIGGDGPQRAALAGLARRRGLSLLYSHHGETFMDAHQAFD